MTRRILLITAAVFLFLLLSFSILAADRDDAGAARAVSVGLYEENAPETSLLTITRNTVLASDRVLAVAVYDVNGRMTEMTIIRPENIANQNEIETGLSIHEGYTYKVFELYAATFAPCPAGSQGGGTDPGENEIIVLPEG